MIRKVVYFGAWFLTMLFVALATNPEAERQFRGKLRERGINP